MSFLEKFKREGGMIMARTSFKLGRSSNPAMSKEDLRKLIEKKAYELYAKRGCKPGHAHDDWLEAERIVKGKLSK
jgi:hypothetical protein